MTSFVTDFFTSSPLTDTVRTYWNNLISTVTGAQILIAENHKILTFYESLLVSLNFDEFQCKLLKGFSLILLVNLLLICVAWKVFGKRICERFMKPTTSKAIEELKASVSRLKLPKEHTPRI